MNIKWLLVIKLQNKIIISSHPELVKAMIWMNTMICLKDSRPYTYQETEVK
jgi:hypothetical protein